MESIQTKEKQETNGNCVSKGIADFQIIVVVSFLETVVKLPKGGGMIKLDSGHYSRRQKWTAAIILEIQDS